MTHNSTSGSDATAEFENLRAPLMRLGYRMTGSVADAEDIVQETWLRWNSAGQPAPDNPKAYFSMIATRLCLDRLKRASRQREHYVGVWLPEPVVADWSLAAHAPDAVDGLDLSYAFMTMLERLTPLERAAYLLHDLFDVTFGEIADVLERTPSACRKLASRARRNIKDGPQKYQASASELARLAMAFTKAVSSGSVEPLQTLFAEDILFLSDGGGKAPAALNPVHGANAVARLLLGLAQKQDMSDAAGVRILAINGSPGIAFISADGRAQSVCLDLDPEGRFATCYIVRNPDKTSGIRNLLTSPAG